MRGNRTDRNRQDQPRRAGERGTRCRRPRNAGRRGSCRARRRTRSPACGRGGGGPRATGRPDSGAGRRGHDLGGTVRLGLVLVKPSQRPAMVASRPMPTRYQTTVEREHGAGITAVVGAEELERLAVPDGLDTARHLLVIWVEIALLLVAAGAIGSLPFPLTVLCAVVVIVLMGTRINALNVVMHEASHGFLCKDRTRNDRLCNATASWWMLHSVEEYRPTHRLHHRYLNGPEDPDLPSYLIPGRRGALARLLALDLLGVTALRRALSLVSNASSDEAGSARLSGGTALRNIAGKLAAQGLLIAVFVMARGWVVGLVG